MSERELVSRVEMPPAAEAKAAGPALVHLPTWSRIRIATKQRAPLGRGGDFFEVVQHRDGRVSTVMADVCGNGPSAAGPVSQLRWVLRQQLTADRSPGQVLETLNDWMTRERASVPFATAVCVRVDPMSGRVTMASAGHLGPFVKRARGGVEELPLSSGLALGIVAGEAYPDTRAELHPEDVLVLVTDGISDGLASAQDPLGESGVLDRLRRARHGAESICAALLGPGACASQDATVVVLHLPRRHRRATPAGGLQTG